MRLAVIWEKALQTDSPTAPRTDGPTDGPPSYRDATAHLKKHSENAVKVGVTTEQENYRQTEQLTDTTG